MRAIVLHGVKDIRVETIADPPMGMDEARVRFGAGGICGSDLSYYFKGRVGDFAIREPLVLGHEVAGEIEAVGAAVEGLQPGDKVAVNPSRPCLHCDYCRSGRGNLCRDMRFFGSAALFPHVQGAFCETIVARADQCVKVPRSMPMRVAACAEPLSVAFHTAKRAGDLLGRKVLIAGAGPIGLLCALVARRAGAAMLVITDIADEPLSIAREIGADQTINVKNSPEGLASFEAGKGFFDIAIEATGSPLALETLFTTVRPGGRIVQVGMMPPGHIPVPVNLMMAREIDFVGAFRFHEEFATAVDSLARGLIDVRPILSAEFVCGSIDEAFAVAADRTRSIKVHLHF